MPPAQASRHPLPGKRVSWPFVAGAALFHALLIALAALVVPARLPPPPEEETVPVEIVMQAPPPVPVQAPPTTVNVPPDLPAPALPETRTSPPPATAEDADGLTPASRTYAAKVLEDPRSRGAKRALPLLAADERLIQLCNIEAMEQVRLAGNGFVPEAVVAYAMADMEIGQYTLFARGAAFRTGRHWYNIAYKCRARPDFAAVTSFAFKVGEEIPEKEWESHSLALDHGHLD